MHYCFACFSVFRFVYVLIYVSLVYRCCFLCSVRSPTVIMIPQPTNKQPPHLAATNHHHRHQPRTRNQPPTTTTTTTTATSTSLPNTDKFGKLYNLYVYIFCSVFVCYCYFVTTHLILSYACSNHPTVYSSFACALLRYVWRTQYVYICIPPSGRPMWT